MSALTSFGALSPKPLLVGKFVATTVQGDAFYTSDGRVLALKQGDVIRAGGTAIETSAHGKVVLLFSNQTSVLVEPNTRLEIQKFEQEFFVRNNDVRAEPSTSSTDVRLLRGRVLVNTPALRNGTNLIYRTSQAAITILGERVMISASDQETRVAVISGSAVVENAGGGNDILTTDARLVAGQSIRLRTRLNRSAAATSGALLQPTSLSTDRESAARRADAALAAGVHSAVLSAPESAVKIVATAVAATPERAAAIAYAAANAAPDQAPQITFAAVEAASRSNTSSPGHRLRAAAGIAASAASASPGNAGQITASAIQALLQAPAANRSSDSRIEIVGTITAAVVSVAPDSSGEIISLALSSFGPAGPAEANSEQDLTVSLARVVAAAARVAPDRTESIAVAAVSWLMQNSPHLSSDALAETAGLIAAIAGQASPERASTINAGIASATNLSVSLLEAGAARSTALAAQLGLQVDSLVANIAFAGTESREAGASLALGLRPRDIADQPANPSPGGDAAVTLANFPEGGESGDNPAPASQVIQFDPAAFGDLAGDLAAVQAAQDELVFDTETTPDGPPNVLPVPTVPATLPIEFVTSPANGNG